MTVLLGTLLSSIKQIEAPYVFEWEKAIALDTMQTESGLILQGGESLMGFLDLRPEPGLYSRVTGGMFIRNSSLFIEVRNLCRYEGQLRNVN